jgi:hydrogenase expression/formation protein HypC
MCLAIPGRIVAIHEALPDPISPTGAGGPGRPEDADLWRTATVDFGGVRQQVSLACLPEARHGDQVLVHVGLAISLVQEEGANPLLQGSRAPQRPAALRAAG